MLRRTCLILACFSAAAHVHAERPNVILIMTDDQGYGDFGVTGNPVIATPHLDAFAAQGVSMKTFYVSPVCSPTRASLMTGRYNYRTRVVDTYLGRSMMDPTEVTLAEVLRGAGYATGIFGKWHLGDNYPLRAMDQGFEESMVIRGGGLAQPSDPPENARRYTDPVLVHNGTLEAAKGYCTDVFFGSAIEWIRKSRAAGRPFFAYIAPNAPHDPLHDVPEELRRQYAQKDLAQLLPRVPGQTPARGPLTDALERIAAMITNIDDNVGRLLAALESEGLADDTLVIFLCDNGPAGARYNGPFRGRKSEVYEGGVRSPFWMRWSGTLPAGQAREEAVAHIDVMPTILEACGVTPPAGVAFDGRSFWRLASAASEAWPARPLAIQTHRGDVPVKRHHFMLREGDWKLVHASGFGRETIAGAPRFELFNLRDDPGESRDLVSVEPDLMRGLLAKYDAWFEDVSRTRPENFAPPRIRVGTPHENPTTLTRQDWRGGTWAEDANGHWLVTIEPGRYEVTATFTPKNEAGAIELRVGEFTGSMPLAAGAGSCRFEELNLPGGDAELHLSIRSGSAIRGVFQVEIARK